MSYGMHRVSEKPQLTDKHVHVCVFVCVHTCMWVGDHISAVKCSADPTNVQL